MINLKNEIKEILEFKENADYKKLSVDEIAILKDCITNLQEDLDYQRQAEIDYNKKHTKLMRKYKKLQQENERLNIQIEMALKKAYPFVVENGIICRKNKEIERLNNIIKEIRKMLYKKTLDDYDTYTANVVCDFQSDFEEIVRLNGGDEE